MLNGIDHVNFGSILNDYVWLDCCYSEVINVCWNSLGLVFMGCSHMLELLSFV